MKEQILKFDGTPVFPERRAYSPTYQLSDAESKLYKGVTECARDELSSASALETVRRGGTGSGKIPITHEERSGHA